MTIVRRTWYEQPPLEAARADFTSPFARTWTQAGSGLWIPGKQNLVSGKSWTSGGTGAEPTFAPTTAGLGLYTSGKYIQTDLPSASASVLSWIAIIRPDAAPNTGGTFSSLFQTGQFTFNWNHTSASYNGAFTIFNSGLYNTCRFTSGFTARKVEIIGGTYDGVALRAYRIGVLENSTTTANGLSGVPLNSLQFLGGTGGTAAWAGACPFFLWDTTRAYSAAEMAELMGNVWQVFEPRRILVPVPTAGGSFSATGALAADAATLSGSASHLTLHPSSGALSAGSATLAGTATHLTLHTATGALAADAATVAGSASLTSTGSFSATGSLSADVATLSGAAAHYTLHTATGAIAADAATVEGTAQHLTLHTATGALIADAASVSGVAVHSGDGAVIEVRNVGAGKSRRKSQRYVLAIDGKDVIVSDYSEAQALIDRAKEEAEAKAEEAQRRANASQRRPIGKVIRDARKALKAPSIEAPPELEDYARKVIADIQATYDQRLKDIEITALMRQRERQQEEDDEEVLMLIA